jgi:hypothetical protein
MAPPRRSWGCLTSGNAPLLALMNLGPRPPVTTKGRQACECALWLCGRCVLEHGRTTKAALPPASRLGRNNPVAKSFRLFVRIGSAGGPRGAVFVPGEGRQQRTRPAGHDTCVRVRSVRLTVSNGWWNMKVPAHHALVQLTPSDTVNPAYATHTERHSTSCQAHSHIFNVRIQHQQLQLVLHNRVRALGNRAEPMRAFYLACLHGLHPPR